MPTGGGIKIDGRIIRSDIYGPTNQVERREYRMEGRVARVHLNAFFGDANIKNDLMIIGSLRLRILDYDPVADYYTVTQMHGWRHHFLATCCLVNRWIGMVYNRTLLTASIWNLAGRSPGRCPAANDLYIVQYIKRWWVKCVSFYRS